NLRDDLKPLTAEIKRLPNRTMQVASLKKGEKPMTAKTNLKLHLLQIQMGWMEMMLTRRARKTARRSEKTEKRNEKYQATVTRMRKEFKSLNPKITEKLQNQAKTMLTKELTELENQKTKRANAQESQTQK